MTTVLRLAASDAPLVEHDLTEGESEQFAALPSAARKHSWLVARRALRRALAAAGLPPDTAAVEPPSAHASLAYDDDDFAVAAALHDDSGRVLGLGIDVETGAGPSSETAPLFLGDRELAEYSALSSPHRETTLRQLWTIKEALYKADPDGTFDLRRYRLDRPLARHGVAAPPGETTPRQRYLTLDLPHGALAVAITLSRNGSTAQ